MPVFTFAEGAASVIVNKTKISANIDGKTYLMGPILYNEGINDPPVDGKCY